MRRPLLVAALVAVLAVRAEAKDGKKIFISIDMEGVTGVVTSEQLSSSGFEYNQFRELMTAEANAAIEAARAAGGSEFVIADAPLAFEIVFAVSVELVTVPEPVP